MQKNINAVENSGYTNVEYSVQNTLSSILIYFLNINKTFDKKIYSKTSIFKSK